MAKRLFICEKPSLGRAIADALAEISGSPQSKGKSGIRVGSDTVTWALGGHMYELESPDFYDPALKTWSNLSRLPFAPDKWRRRSQGGNDDHLAAIKGMIRDTDHVVNVGDAEREGQLIIDEMLEEMGWDPFTPRTFRVWVKSYAMRDVVAAINGMFPNSDKRNLSTAAVLRQRADWTHGLNLTRLYTTLARNTGADRLLSVGRVQTPTLKLVVDRDREIEAFKPVDHYLPAGFFRHANGTFKADWIVPDDYDGLDSEGRLVDRKVADAISAKVMGKTGRIESCETKPKSKEPPLPYSMSALQTECSSRLGLTAAQTMEVAQALYEKHKATTYPRTDSRHLPKTILKDEAPGIMAALAATPGFESAKSANMALKSGAWDDAKVSDHHAIIPTTEFSAATLAGMSAVERGVFEIIAKPFIAQFFPDFRWKSLSAVVEVEKERFRATGRVIVDNGWKAVYGAAAEDEDDKEADQTVPAMAKGDPATAERTEVASKRTTPPPYFTDGTLIAAMSRVERFVTDPAIKRKLKEVDGIGTEATRAATIEGLLSKRKEYLKRDGKTKIKSTPVGRLIVDSVPKEVSDPGMTAIWEAQLGKIEKGEASADQFWQVLMRTLGGFVEKGRAMGGITIKGSSVEPLPGSGVKCPKCGKGTMVTVVGRKGSKLEGKRYLRCDNWRKDDPTSCDNVVWPDSDRPPVKPIEGDGKPCPVCHKGTMRTRVIASGDNKGRSFLSCDAWKKDDPKSCSHREFPKDEVKGLKGEGDKCPKCGKGHFVTKQIHKGDNKGKRFLSCSAYPACDGSVFPEEGGWKSDGPRGGGGGKPGAKPAGGARPGASGRPAAPAGRLNLRPRRDS